MNNKTIVTLGILSAIVLLVPELVVFSIIIPPLFFLLSLLPALYFYGLLFAGTSNAFAARGNLRWVIATGIVIVTAFGIPLAYNQTLHHQVDAILAEDINIDAPLSFETISLVLHNPAFPSGCDTLCQKLLYNGKAKTVIVRRIFPQRKKRTKRQPQDTAFHVEKRENCSVKGKEYMLKNVSLRIAAGECLIGEPAPLNNPKLFMNIYLRTTNSVR